ncbi:MAG TPA: DUF2065 domain-containing protein [Pseudomonadales bacterium]|nr:DUF2065 domain-containing protein [Pseudomonadales bacterium]
MALMLVFEGLLPFIAPDKWRRVMQEATQLDNRHIRLIGLVSMVVGVLALYWARGG